MRERPGNLISYFLNTRCAAGGAARRRALQKYFMCACVCFFCMRAEYITESARVTVSVLHALLSLSPRPFAFKN